MKPFLFGTLAVVAAFIIQPVCLAAEKQNAPDISPAPAPAARIAPVPASLPRNDLEFDTLRVPLPAPADIPWKGPFFNSANFAAEHATWALEVLPGWIRKAVVDSPKKDASGYLHSLLQLLKSDDPELKYDTALALYRLGFTGPEVMDVFKSGLDADGDRSTFNRLVKANEFLTQRTLILRHLRFYADDTLLPHIESLVARVKEKEPQGRAARELALYLESRNRPQPDAFWLGQLNSPGGVEDALRILQKRHPAGFDSVLTDLFGKTANPMAKTQIASAAFQLGYGGAEFETHLFQRAETVPQPGIQVDLTPALAGLLHRKSARALKLAENLLHGDVEGLHEHVLRALASAPPELALPVIEEYVEDSIRRHRFPSEALQTLLRFDPKIGGPAYEKHKAALLKAGPVDTDFNRLEFYRQHRDVLE